MPSASSSPIPTARSSALPATAAACTRSRRCGPPPTIKVGAKFVILNNGAYQLLKLNIKQYWKDQGLPENEFPASFDLRDPDIRFDQLAQAMGVGSARVETPDQVGPALDAAFADDKPFLIDLVVSNEVKHDVATKKHARAGQS